MRDPHSPGSWCCPVREVGASSGQVAIGACTRYDGRAGQDVKMTGAKYAFLEENIQSLRMSAVVISHGSRQVLIDRVSDFKGA